MIERLRGTVIAKNNGSVALDVHDVGYKIFMTKNNIESLTLKSDVSILCFQHVSETALDLYGFLDTETRYMFTLLISISGVGPKSALSILDTADIRELRQAVVSEDPKILTSVAGIGPKLAGRIVLELKNKLVKGEGDTLASDRDIIDGLTALGFTKQQARDALKGIDGKISDPEKRLTNALKHLGKH